MRLELGRPRRSGVSLSLTPLIDVVFMLLLFFMLSTQFAHWRTMMLEATDASGAAVSDEKGVELWLREDGSADLDGLPVVLDELGTRVGAFTTVPIVVRAEGGVPLQRIVDALDALRATGVRGVSLGASQ